MSAQTSRGRADELSSSLINVVIPRGAIGCEAIGDGIDAALFDKEQEAIERAVDKRRREFVTGRALARRALAALGVEPVAIPVGRQRAPQWPTGILGSITHCEGYCAAAVALHSAVASIGIDAEVHAPLPRGIIKLIASPEEELWLGGRQVDDVSWDRLLFSAKESLFKAWWPLTRQYLEFHDATVRFVHETRAFRAELGRSSRPWAAIEGRYLSTPQFLLTCVAVPRRYGRRIGASADR